MAIVARQHGSEQTGSTPLPSFTGIFLRSLFYGLNPLDRKKRNWRKNDRKRRNRLRDIEGSNTPFFTVTFLRSNFFITHPAVKEGTGVHWRWTGSGLEIYRQWAMI